MLAVIQFIFRILKIAITHYYFTQKCKLLAGDKKKKIHIYAYKFCLDNTVIIIAIFICMRSCQLVLSLTVINSLRIVQPNFVNQYCQYLLKNGIIQIL